MILTGGLTMENAYKTLFEQAFEYVCKQLFNKIGKILV